MSEKRPRRLRGGRLVLAIAVVVGCVLLLGRMAVGLYVEILWAQATGYLSVFLTRMAWQWAIRVVVAVVTGTLAAINLVVVATTLRGIRIRRRFGNIEISERIPRSYLRGATFLMAALVGLWFAAAVGPDAAHRALLLIHAPEWGVAEPVLGHDVSFYVFVLPVLNSAVVYAMVLLFVLFTFATAGYAATGSLRWEKSRLELGTLAHRHLVSLAGLFLLALAARFWLARYSLLLDGSSGVQGIFGFTDAEARLPGLQALTGVSVMAAALVVWGGMRGRVGWVASGIGAVVVAGLVLGQLYPSMIQRFRVEPNELEREAPYIEHNLSFTRVGFGLESLRRERLSSGDSPPWSAVELGRQLEGLPAWTRGALLSSFREVEARFPYYDFADVTIDRYASASGPQTVALAVREVDPLGIQDPNWQNLHLRELYLVGMGAVASAGSARTAEGRPVTFLSGIPPGSSSERGAPPALRLSRPQVFFGASPQLYAVVDPSGQTFLAPDGSPGIPGQDYPAGIPLTSVARKLALAWRFRDPNLLFASEISPESRFVFRRHARTQASHLAPFLSFPAEPYPVIVGGRIVWVLDGYTQTRHFPLSTSYEMQVRRPLRYIRNSVKVTVDAATGEMSFYTLDANDPILMGLRGAFPGLLRSLEEMPEELRAHLRFPRELLELQSRVLFQYHQETAPTFHGQQDVWSAAQELSQGTNPVPYRPEYGRFELPGERGAEFLLSTVFVPAGRQNLTALLVARCDPDRYGELLLYEFPVEEQVPGPRQVEALVEQDPVISQQFSLWRQGGSQVWTGHLHVVPAGPRVLYMEPIFLAAEADAIPELRRFVLSDGRRVVMTPTLEEAIAELSPGAPLPSEPPVRASVPGLPAERWPEEALRLLDEAEQRLREGDWAGFGERLRALRAFLQGGFDGASGESL